MEVTSRASIQDRIRDKNDCAPELKNLNIATTKALTDFHVTNHSRLSKFARLRQIYQLADEVVDTDKDISVCRKGCAWCCRIRVEITPLEAAYIASNTENRIRYKSTKKPGPIGYCPMLNKLTGECTVYNYRPFNCRTFLAYDSPEYCKNKEDHWVSGGPHNDYGSEAIFSLATAMLEVELGGKIGPTAKVIAAGRIKDIREFFR